MNNRKALLAALFRLDAVLVTHGVPALSPKWRADLTRWAERGTRRLVIRAGRRSGKSLTLCKLAIALALFGGVTVPTGDTAWAVFVSTTIVEALARLATIATFLDKLGVPYDRNGNQIRLSGAPLGFVVLACSHRSAVGLTAYFVGGDEVSRWEVEGSNPAEEVAATLLPMLLTVGQSIDVWSSSVLGTLDLHAQMVAAGDDDSQTVIQGATWEYNPTTPEDVCRKAARTQREFEREYANIPQAGILSAFPSEIVLPAFIPRSTDLISGEQIMITDPSSGGASSADWFTFGRCSWCTDERDRWLRYPDGSLIDGPHALGRWENPAWEAKPPVLVFHEIDGIEGGFFGNISGDDIAKRLARVAAKHSIRHVHSDQRESLFLSSSLKEHGLTLHPHAWTSASKPKAVELVRRWLSDHLLSLPPHERLKQELLSFEERITPSGALTFGARSGGHDDHVALLITAAHAELEGTLPSSPFNPPFKYQAAPAWLANY